jgi:hypothetical protein
MSDQQRSESSTAVAADSAAEQPARESVSERPGFRLRLTKPHRLIQNTQPESTCRDSFGSPLRNPQKGVDVRVSKGMFKTALVVMDRFIKALEAQDLAVEVTNDQRERGTFARQGDDRVQLHISEKHKRVEHVPSAKELREKERYSWTRIPKWDNVPTGELVLEPGGVVDLSSDAAINQLISKAVADAIDNLGRVRKQREAAQAAQKLEWDRRRRIEEEKKRVAALHQAAEALRQYRALTKYIEEVRRFGRVPDDQRCEGQTLEQWLRWAEARAKDIHPLGG